MDLLQPYICKNFPLPELAYPILLSLLIAGSLIKTVGFGL